MDHPTFDPLRQHLIYQMSQNLLRLQLEASINSLNSPMLSPDTPPSPFLNFPTTPTTNSGYFNWPSPMSWPCTPTLPNYLMPPNVPVKQENSEAAIVQQPPAIENRGYSRWWETNEDDNNKGRNSSGGDSGRGASETPSSVEEDEDVFVDDDNDTNTNIDNNDRLTDNLTTPPSSRGRKLPPKKRPRNLPPLPTLQNPDISSSSCGSRPPMTLPAPFTMPVTPLSIPNTPHSMPASPWHLLLQRHQLWNTGAPFSPAGPAPSSPTFFKFPPPPSFLSPQSETSPGAISTSPEPSSVDSHALSSMLSAVTPEWMESLRRQLSVLPSDSLHLMSDSEREARRSSMENLTEDQYDNVRRYLEKRSYSVRDDIGKEDYMPRPIILRSEFVSLRTGQIKH